MTTRGGSVEGRLKISYDKDADPSRLRGKTIAILGYGSQGHAHALNLKDSGHDVIIGLRAGSESRPKAEAAGLHVKDTAEAARWGDIVMMLVPDELAPETYERDVSAALGPGRYFAVAHGFSIHFRKIVPPAGVNVFMVAPKSPGHLLRHEFSKGEGVPMLLAVHQDPSGDTRDVALAYACAIGGGRAGVIETTFKDETETDLFGEQAVLCGGLTSLVSAGFETLVEAGYPPEMAYFECLHEMKLIVDLMYEGGIANMRYSVSNTAEYGDLTRGPRVIGPEARRVMKQLLADIQSGEFADEWMAEHKAGKPNFRRLEAAGREHLIERVGERLRAMMPWLSRHRLVDRSRN
jgi:ketol-acid reductoisomerase